ncbi:phosphoglycerate kinase [symbiont of Argiope bruennichi]
MTKKTLSNIFLENQTVFLSCDFNVPLTFLNGEYVVNDDTRIKASFETIDYLLEKNAKIVIFSHLGRIKSESDKKKNSLWAVYKYFEKNTNYNISFFPLHKGKEFENQIKNLKSKEILLLENTRYLDLENEQESKNNPELAKYWASLCDVFVGNSFGLSHRKHCSNYGIPTFQKNNCLGFLMEKELFALEKITSNPKKPYYVLMGGAKVSDKIKIINNLIEKVDKLLIGGKMAYTFIYSLGFEVGKSGHEEDQVEYCKNLLKTHLDKIILPIDFKVIDDFRDDKPKIVSYKEIPSDHMGLDIGPLTIKLFENNLSDAQTIAINGPVGVFEFENFSLGTKEVFSYVSEMKNCFTFVGGGDSAFACNKFNLQDKMSFISTGGGASLQYLEGKTLPGVDIICEK